MANNFHRILFKGSAEVQAFEWQTVMEDRWAEEYRWADKPMDFRKMW